MKEKMTTNVSSGEVLQLHSGSGPVGRPVKVPEGVTSIRIIFKDTEGLKAKFDQKNRNRSKPRGLPTGESHGGQSDKSESGFIARETESRNKPKVPSSR